MKFEYKELDRVLPNQQFKSSEQARLKAFSILLRSGTGKLKSYLYLSPSDKDSFAIYFEIEEL